MARQMKDSGVEWIGEIPADWAIIKGKNILSILERPIKEDDGIITCFRDGEVTLRSKRREDGFTISLQEEGYQGIEPDDLVVHGMDGFAGAIGISDSRGKGTPVLNVMASTECKKYIMYYLRIMAITGVFLALSTGIRVRSCDTNWKKLKNLLYPVPEIFMQQKIANFLDNKCAKIDTTLEKTCASIEEYKKLKQAIITKAVTKGIRGDRPMKDSGIKWIGDIPADWMINRFKNVGQCWNGLTYSPNNLCDESDGILVLRSSNVQNGTLVMNDNVYVNCSISAKNMVQKNDILICSRNGSAKLIGKNALIEDDINAAFGAFMMIYRCKHPKYMRYILNSDVFLYNLSSFLTSTVNQLTAGVFNNIKFPFTKNIEEQQEIVDYLDKKCVTIDTLIAKKEQLITQLETYKKSLIYEYVTGKKELPV